MYISDGVAHECSSDEASEFNYYYLYGKCFIASNNLKKLKEDIKAKRLHGAFIETTLGDIWVDSVRSHQMLCNTYYYKPRYYKRGILC